MNRNVSLIVNGVLVVAVAVLFYLLFSSNKTGTPANAAPSSSSPSQPFRIAYFELDSVENSFTMMKTVKSELSKEEERIAGEMERLQRTYNDKVKQFQLNKNLSQVESENMQKELLALQQTAGAQKQTMDQNYQNLWMRKMQEVKSNVEVFLKDYNKSKGYSYIFANEPNLMYFRDTMYNITSDVIKGLNEKYGGKR